MGSFAKENCGGRQSAATPRTAIAPPSLTDHGRLAIARRTRVAYTSPVRFLRQHKFTLLFLGVLVFCSVMVIRQMDWTRSRKELRHVELREAMILLQTGGYTNDAIKLYFRLWRELEKLPDKQLVDDGQRAVVLIDPSLHQPSNTIYQYYWNVRQEMERRADSHIDRARKLAAEEK